MKAHLTRTKTAAAVSALLAAAAVSPASAVNLASNGIGDAFETAYYSVLGGYQTNISIANTSDTYVVALKIRFHESNNSRDARDFDIFLAPNDVWNGVLGLNAGSNIPYIQTSDTSCTVPTDFPAGYSNTATNRANGFVVIGNTAAGAPVKRMDLTNIDYINSAAAQRADGGSTSYTRAAEGYVEVIEMGVAIAAPALGGSALAQYAVPNVSGVRSCGKLANVFGTTTTPAASIKVTGSGIGCNRGAGTTDDPSFTVGSTVSGNNAFKAEFCEPLNVLKVESTMIRAGTGQVFGVPTTTFANFYNVTIDGPTGLGTEVLVYTPSGSEGLNPPVYGTGPQPNDLMAPPTDPATPAAAATREPTLDDVRPAVSTQTLGGLPVTASFEDVGDYVGYPVDAVSSLLTATSVINNYLAAPTGLPQTAWAITFPTKAFYVDNLTYTTALFPGRHLTPFEHFFSPAGSSCLDIGLVYFNTEGVAKLAAVPPSPNGEPAGTICTETQTLNFALGGNLLSSSQFTGSGHGFSLQSGFTAGWAKLIFPGPSNGTGAITSNTEQSFPGLPTTGFALTAFTNGAIASGYLTPHSYERFVQP